MRNNKGFTLIELLVVIAIIGLLATLAVVSLTSAQEKARDTKRIADVKQIQTALELYYSDNGAYPEPLTWTELETLLATYAENLPVDPINRDAAAPPVEDGTDMVYVYMYEDLLADNADDADDYVVATVLEQTDHATLDQDHDLDYSDNSEWADLDRFMVNSVADGLATDAALWDCDSSAADGNGAYCLTEQ